MLKGWSQERGGNVQFSFSNTLNEQGKKTATETQVASATADLQVSLDLQVFQDQMADVHYQLDALWMQFGSDSEEIAITNQPPERISRREVQGKYNIVPNGRLDNTLPALRLAIAFNLMRTFINDPDINQDQLKKVYLDYVDVKYSDILLKTPEQKQQEQQAMMQQQQQAKVQAIQEGVALKQLENQLENQKEEGKAVIDIKKEIALEPIHGKKFAPN